MDLYVQRLRDLPNEGRMRRLLLAASVDRNVLSRNLGRYFFGDDSDAAAGITDAAFSRHARLQRLFYSTLVAGVIRAAGPVFPRLRRFLGLSYAAQRRRSVGSFAGEISYRHPLTCESHTTTFEALAARAGASAAESIGALWRALDAEDPASELSGLRGPSLETGLTTGALSALTCSEPDRFDAFLPPAMAGK